MEFSGSRFIVIEGKWVCEVMEAKGSKEFGHFIDRCKLVDLPLLGKKFTWIGPDNKRSKLDRFLLEEEWLVQLKDLQQQGLNKTISDHILVLLVNETIEWGPRPFKFVNGWFKKQDCRRLIEKEWLGMSSLKGKMAGKLQKLKGALKKWNVDVGDVLEKRIIKNEDRIKEIDEASEHRMLTEILNEEISLRFEEPYLMDGIKEAVWSCDESKAPRLDGDNEGVTRALFLSSVAANDTDLIEISAVMLALE
ncbi:hypothetical protein Goshw_025665, partial [Gossypium schwendimanii]|nr:hypothetical protein [Gossypium schwendimanii]